MKLYRFLKQGVNDSKGLYLKKGWNNEFINLMEFQKISPSPHFGARNFTPSQQDKGTFKPEREMSKYFYASLAETIMYAENCLYRDNMLGHETEYIIMEVDAPDELIKEYIGLGYYVHDNMYVEFCIPYDVLYALIGKKEASVSSAIRFYQSNFEVQNKELLRQYNTLKRKYQDKLAKLQEDGIAGFNMMDIYPLLCFSLKHPINIINFGGFQNSKTSLEEYANMACKALIAREKCFDYDRVLATINSEIRHGYKDQVMEAKSKLYDFTYPIITEENDIFKRTLRKKYDI